MSLVVYYDVSSQLEVERALLEGELVPLREKVAADEERLAALLQRSNELEDRCQQERHHHQEAIEVSITFNFHFHFVLQFCLHLKLEYSITAM